MEIPDRLITLIRPLTISWRHWRGSALEARDGPVPGWVTEFLRAVTNTSQSVNISRVASFSHRRTDITNDKIQPNI